MSKRYKVTARVRKQGAIGVFDSFVTVKVDVHDDLPGIEQKKQAAVAGIDQINRIGYEVHHVTKVVIAEDAA